VRFLPVVDRLLHNEPDIPGLVRDRDHAALIRLLGSRDQDLVTEAVHALGTLGPEATGPLLAALDKKGRVVRLGIISALAEIRDPRAVFALVRMLKDPSSEVRWQAAIALGETGDSSATAALLDALRDSDKYVRYGSALSLIKIGYKPSGDEDWAWYYAGTQDWEGLKNTGHPALPVLFNLMKDPDSEVRVRAVRTLGETGDRDAGPVLLRALADESRQVRWEAALASQKCGVPPGDMPRALLVRPRASKSPLIAGFLNFMLPGLGYGYLGKWWGIMIFQIDITLTVWLFKIGGESMTYEVLLSVYFVLALHAWYITKIMPEDPP
jgi:HEAT repeat protein